MLYSLLKHYLELFITDIALKVSRSFTVSPLLYLMVLKTFFPRLWGKGISNAILFSTAKVMQGQVFGVTLVKFSWI